MTTDLSNYKFTAGRDASDIMECVLCEERVHVTQPGDLLSDLVLQAEIHEDECEGLDE